MARLNVPAPSTPESKPLTHEGAPAVRIGSYNMLRRSVLACLLWEDEFYESGTTIATRINALVEKVAPEAARDLAIEARERFKLRHVPLWLARSMARLPEHKVLVAETLERIIQRPDELTEFLALYWKGQKDAEKESLSAQVKKGLARAFRKFNAYQLAKYNRPDAIKLRDVLFLCHAKPQDAEQAQLWEQLVKGTLPVPDTWEVAISAAKGDKELTQATWLRLLQEKKLGGLALLRNLRNMQQAGIRDVDLAAALAGMRTDRILPYRFVAAARYAPQLEPALEGAMIRCVQEQPKLLGRTVLLVDVSGSMADKLSGKSDLSRLDAACALAMLIREVCEEAHIISFSDRAAQVPPRRGFALRDAIVSSQPHGGTNTENGKRVADGLGYDRLIIITDEQSHQRLSPPQGKITQKPGAVLYTPTQGRGYVINVASNRNGIGYGPWTHIDGFSEAVLDFIRITEEEEVAETA